MAIGRRIESIHLFHRSFVFCARRYVIDTGVAQPGKAGMNLSGYLPPQTLDAIGIAGK